MAKRTQSYGLNNPLQDVFPVPVQAQRAPTENDRLYEIGQIWVDIPNESSYILASVTDGGAVWGLASVGTSDLETLTGDSGGTIPPTGGNINILGGDLASVSGAGSTLTVNPTIGGYPITPFVVGTSGQAGYQTVQAAIDAIGASGSGQIWIQPGTYTEDLVFPNGINCALNTGCNESAGDAEIIGVHTPPLSGHVVIWRVKMTSSSHIFSGTGAGNANLILVHNKYSVNGYIWNLPNWKFPGALIARFIDDQISTASGIVNNTGGARFFSCESSLGVGTTFPMIVTGLTSFEVTNVGCPVLCQTGSSLDFYLSNFTDSITLANDSSGTIHDTSHSTGATPPIIMSSSGNVSLFNSTIDSSNNPSISGAGSGTLTLTGINFLNNSDIASTLTLASGITSSGAFNTLNPSTALNLSANMIVAAGFDTNIPIVITPKGNANLNVANGSLELGTAASQLRVHGGAVTDFIGQTTLVLGTVTVANTNIQAEDKIFLSREGIGASTMLGQLLITITANTNFIITSVLPGSPGTTATGDLSTLNYFIVRQTA